MCILSIRAYRKQATVCFRLQLTGRFQKVGCESHGDRHEHGGEMGCEKNRGSGRSIRRNGGKYVEKRHNMFRRIVANDKMDR